MVCKPFRGGGAAPTGEALWLFLWEPRPPGRWVVVCKPFRGEGAAPTGEALWLFLWEPRPRGDGRWSASLFAAGAPLLQGWRCGCFCGSPAPGAMGGGLRAFSRRGRRSYRGGAVAVFVGAPPSGRWVVVCERPFAAGAPLLQGKRCGCFCGSPAPRGDGGDQTQMASQCGYSPTRLTKPARTGLATT